MRGLIVLAVSVGSIVVGGLGAIAFGLPDVAATTPHWGVTEWALSTTMENSVRRRAASIPIPGDLGDARRVRAGAAAYDAMCVGCHGAPGIDADVVAEGLLPRPPELARAAADWSLAELFWITRHGIRMTGMPAFGPTHTDREIWDVVAFLHDLPDLSPAGYGALTANAGDAHHHEHRDGRGGEGHHRH